MIKYFLTAMLLLGSIMIARGEKKITPDNNNIVVEGAIYLKMKDGKMVIDRHSEELFSKEGVFIHQGKANTQSGVRIIFKTDSKTIKPIFTEREGAEHRKVTNFYGIYKNGEFLCDINGDELVLTSEKEITEWEIVLPIMYAVNFEGIMIDDDADMFDVKRPLRPVYIAIGDSITHGAGQTRSGSQIAYPYVLAENNGYYLYNLAVGGSQISPAIAQDTRGIKADIITVMWGFNDWNATKGDIAEISRRYTSLLTELRKEQPTAKVYCIMPSTAKDENGKSKVKLSAVRDAERKIVKSMYAKGDKNIFVIEGGRLSSVEDLNGNVHFNNEGARKFGEALAKEIR